MTLKADIDALPGGPDYGRDPMEGSTAPLDELVAQALADRLKLQAQIHAQEARTANATIAEIYQLCTGATGEPGNWNGVEPVRKVIAERDAALARLAGLVKQEPVAKVDEGDDGRFVDIIYGMDGSSLKLGDMLYAAAGASPQPSQAQEPNPAYVTLPRELDEDLYYMVGVAMGAQSPEQCGRADSLWVQLVTRADSDAKRRAAINAKEKS